MRTASIVARYSTAAFGSALRRPSASIAVARRLYSTPAQQPAVEPLSVPSASAAAASTNPKVIKIVDEIATLTLLETSELVTLIKSRFNIQESAVQVVAAAPGGAPAAGAADAAAAEPAEKPAEKTSFKVKLVKFNAESKAKVIREVKSLVPNMTLVDAKKLVESAPKVLQDNVPKDEAEKLKKALEAAGAEISLE
ncbi:ClpS-like protein [Ramicandelaber brevisporus]|nr:ClpS-like protein [Ramicandelaber brevisporus]